MAKELSVTGQMCAALDKMEGNLRESLKDTGVPVGRFLATAKTAIQTHVDQPALEAADRKSLYLAIQKSASDGLMPDNREAALVIYNTKQKDGTWLKQVNYQPMVQGLVKLARKSGEIEKISAHVVYENDHFKFNPAQQDVPDFSPDWFSEEARGEPIGVWAMIKLTNGEYINEMLTKGRIMRISTRSKVAKNYDPKQGPDWEEWWKKASIRNILKYAPKSTALEGAVNEMDNEFEFDNQPIKESVPIDVITDKPKTETKAAATVKAAKRTKKEEPPVSDEDGEVIDAEVVNEETGEIEEEIPV